MPYVTRYEEAPKDMSLPVSKTLPEGFAETQKSMLFPFRNAMNGKWDYAYFCGKCDGWILGEPNEYEEDTISYRHPLSGRQGTAYYCRRCGNEIAFTGAVA